VIHHRHDNLQPGEGAIWLRAYEFAGDRLVLRPPELDHGSHVGANK